MSDEDEDGLNDLDPMEEDAEQGKQEKPSPVADLESRRRLEAKLEERRLQKLIQDYDFDDIA